MLTTVSIDEAQASFSDLIHRLPPGSEITVTEHGHPVARIVTAKASRPERQLGTLRGTVLHIAPDFDAPLDDFKEYMP
jgi:prevent-host-death family protein